VAWGVENQGLEHEAIVRRVDEFMELLEIDHLKNKLTFAISGGQKQKVSIASNLAMLQKILVLDDPTTDLDPVCTTEVIQMLGRLHREMDKTLIVIEHDLNELIELVNRLIFMVDGRVVHDGPPEKLLAAHFDYLMEHGLNMPQHVEIAHAVLKNAKSDRYPVQRDEAFAVLRDFVEALPSLPTAPVPERVDLGEPVLTVQEVDFSYSSGDPALKGLNLEIRQGEFLAIIGANGSGKSTLVKNLIGLLQPDQGRIVINGRDTKGLKVSQLASEIGYVFQNPDQQLFSSTVYDEIAFSLRIQGREETEIDHRVSEALKTVGLWEHRMRHPYSLSRGQRQKLAVSTALLHEPQIVLLDEPTTGQDRRSLSGLLDMLAELDKEGHTTIMVTHDMDIVAAYATRVIVMENGEIVLDGLPQEIFYDHFEELAALNLKPPTVIDYCRRLDDRGMPRFMTVEALIGYLEEVSG
jgi:energy-coupling factor transport system ATP-binding protein